MTNAIPVNKFFSEYFSEVISCWPENISLNLESFGDSSRYSVHNLWEISEEVADKFIGHSDEIVFVNINHIIFIIVHKMAKYCKYIDMKQLRVDSIYQKFIEKISELKVGGGTGWTEEDLRIAYNLFDH